jgi:hypothetical protein
MASLIAHFPPICHRNDLLFIFKSSPRLESLRQGDIANFDIFIAPFVEQLDAANLVGDLLW